MTVVVQLLQYFAVAGCLLLLLLLVLQVLLVLLVLGRFADLLQQIVFEQGRGRRGQWCRRRRRRTRQRGRHLLVLLLLQMAGAISGGSSRSGGGGNCSQMVLQAHQVRCVGAAATANW